MTAGLTESHDTTTLTTKKAHISSRSQTANYHSQLLNVQQKQLFGILVTSTRGDEIPVPTAPKQQLSTSEKCDPTCRVLALSTLDQMDIILSLRTDLEVIL